MSRYRSVKKARTSESQEKDTWAGLDQIGFGQEVVGFGEALSEPIYFGRAFDSPPQFTYSAVSNIDGADQGLEEVRSIVWPAKELVDSVNPTSPTGRNYIPHNEGLVVDGSFEGQGLFDSYIPRWSEYYTYTSNGPYGGTSLPYQKIVEEQGLGNSNDYPWDLYQLNWWLQSSSSSNDYWSVTSEKASKPKPGGANKYSAKCAIGSDGYTPWMVPMAVPEFSPWVFFDGFPTEEQVLDATWSWLHPAPGDNYSQWAPGGFFEVYENPPLGEVTFEFKTWGPAGTEVETYMSCWDQSFVDKYDPYFYNIYKEETLNHSQSADEWSANKHKFSVPLELWPSAVDSEIIRSEFFGNFRIRMKGAPGATVYLDEVYAWPNLQTRQLLPFITIGVSEWIRDEKDMYVGAILWYKVVNGRPNA